MLSRDEVLHNVASRLSYIMPSKFYIYNWKTDTPHLTKKKMKIQHEYEIGLFITETHWKMPSIIIVTSTCELHLNIHV